jgi:hypothetical protein
MNADDASGRSAALDSREEQQIQGPDRVGVEVL